MLGMKPGKGHGILVTITDVLTIISMRAMVCAVHYQPCFSNGVFRLTVTFFSLVQSLTLYGFCYHQFFLNLNLNWWAIFRAGIYHNSSALLSMFKGLCRVGTPIWPIQCIFALRNLKTCKSLLSDRRFFLAEIARQISTTIKSFIGFPRNGIWL